MPVPASAAPLDIDSRDWPRSLRSAGRTGDEAVARLHALLLRAARFEVARRRSSLPHLRHDELDEMAVEAAGNALVSVLRRLGDFRGDTRFSTWAYKFALVEAAAKLRKRGWQARELPVEPQESNLFAGVARDPDARAEQRELVAALQKAITETLTPHERQVFTAVAVNGVPIDVLAERLRTTRGALYKTLHDSRRKLREQLAETGFTIASQH
jgi:RNA polymerase sigma-70 factor, ECF subfamily